MIPVRAVVLVALALAAASCGGTTSTPSVVSEDQVRAAFAEAGITLKLFPLDDSNGTIVNPSGATLPETVLDPSDGGGFVVYVYAKADDAESLVDSAPTVDPIRGQKRAFLRKDNVVVIVQPATPEQEERLSDIVDRLLSPTRGPDSRDRSV